MSWLASIVVESVYVKSIPTFISSKYNKIEVHNNTLKMNGEDVRFATISCS